MLDIIINGIVAGLLWYPFVLALGLTYRHLKFIDVSVDGVAVVSGIGAAIAWRATGDYTVSIAVAAFLGLLGGCLTGTLIHLLQVGPLLAGVLLSLALHSVSVLAVGESLTLPGSMLAGATTSFVGTLLGMASCLGVLSFLFYKTNFGVLVRALGSNPAINSPLAPGAVLTAGTAFSGLLMGIGAGVYVHTQGLARAGGGFEFLVTGLTSYLAVERVIQLSRNFPLLRVPTHTERPQGISRLRLGVLAFLYSVPIVALVGAVFFQVLVFVVLTWSPRPDIWKVLLAIILVASVARPDFAPIRRIVLRFLQQEDRKPRTEVKPLITVSGAQKSFFTHHSKREILRNVTFTCGLGLTVMTGSNGVGKSTLFRILRGSITQDAGSVLIGERPVDDFPPHLRGVYLIHQDPYTNLAGDLSVYENLLCVVAAGKGPFRLATRKSARDLLESLKSYGYPLPLDGTFGEGFLSQLGEDLSGGEAQCVAIIMALLTSAPVILADEPTGNLDSSNCERVCNLLSSAARDRIVIAVSHDSILQARALLTLKLEGGVISAQNFSDPQVKGEYSGT